MKKYQDFLAEDFTKDDKFVDWVRCPDELSNKFWSALIKTHPHLEREMKDARSFLADLSFEKESLEFAIKESILNNINEQIDQSEAINKSGILQYITAAAAAAIVLAVVFSYFLEINSGQQEYQTGLGATSFIDLPDGSTVNLNANSSIKYSNWSLNDQREVWLKGEAYFDITHSPKIGNQRFIVHTNDLDIEVLGTKFNVNNRSKKTSVTLEEGKVNLYQLEKKNPQTMLAGQRAIVQQSVLSFSDSKITTSNYTSWKESEYLFDHHDFSYIIEILENNYNYKVNIENPKVLEKKISGSIPKRNAQELIDAVCALSGLQYEKTGNEINFKF